MSNLPTITVCDSNTATTVVGTGELDLHNAGVFDEALASAAGTGKPIRIDLRGASYIDTAILARIGVAAKEATKQQKSLQVIVKGGSHPQYVLRIVCFDELMGVVAG